MPVIDTSSKAGRYKGKHANMQSNPSAGSYQHDNQRSCHIYTAYCSPGDMHRACLDANTGKGGAIFCMNGAWCMTSSTTASVSAHTRRLPERGREVECGVDGGGRRRGCQQQRRLCLTAVEAPRHVAATSTRGFRVRNEILGLVTRSLEPA